MLETPKGQSTHKVKMKDMETMDNQQETDFAWLAGILDGEGYVSICMNQHKHRKYGNTTQYLPRVSVGSTSTEIMEKCKRILTELGVGYNITDRKLPSGKIFQSVIIVGMKRVGKLLPFVVPYLTLKCQNAMRIYKFIQMRLHSNTPYTLEELNLVQQCKTGPSETTREALVN